MARPGHESKDDGEFRPLPWMGRAILWATGNPGSASANPDQAPIMKLPGGLIENRLTQDWLRSIAFERGSLRLNMKRPR